MEPKYFAQITEGVVTQVRKTMREFMDENADLYPGFWVEVLKDDRFPAAGWSWSVETGFVEPIYVE